MRFLIISLIIISSYLSQENFDVGEFQITKPEIFLIVEGASNSTSTIFKAVPEGQLWNTDKYISNSFNTAETIISGNNGGNAADGWNIVFSGSTINAPADRPLLPYGLYKILINGSEKLWIDLTDCNYTIDQEYPYGGNSPDLFIKYVYSGINGITRVKRSSEDYEIIGDNDTLRLWDIIDIPNYIPNNNCFQPSSPSNLSISNNNSKVKLEWQRSIYPQNAILKYAVERKPENGPWESLASDIIENNFIDNQTLYNGAQKFYFRVKSLSADGTKSSPYYTNTVSTVTGDPIPSNFTVDWVQDQHNFGWHPKLSWNLVPGALGYTINRTLDNFDYERDFFIPANSNYYIDTEILKFSNLHNPNHAFYKIASKTGENTFSNYSTTKTVLYGILYYKQSNQDGEHFIPKDFNLYNNYPNPFNPETRIRFDLPENSKVTIRIVDISGKIIFENISNKTPGVYHLKWDGKDFNGNQVPSGIYIYTLLANSKQSKKEYFSKRKMVLLK